MLQSSFKADITQRLKFLQTFSATVTSQEAEHIATMPSPRWNSRSSGILTSMSRSSGTNLQTPQIESSGVVPQHSDFRLILGAGLKF